MVACTKKREKKRKEKRVLTQCTMFEESQGFHAEACYIIEDKKQLCLHMRVF